MKKIFVTIIAFCSLMGCYNQEEKVDKSKLLGNDYRLFQGTPAWDLARAVDDGDTAEIKNQVLNKQVKVDFKESRFGNTLLMMAVFNSQYESVKILLGLGADPNLNNNYRGTTAMIEAANNSDSRYVKLLLSHKGNPNALETAPVKGGDMARETALNKAISYKDVNNLERVKYLVEAGADMDYSNEGSPAYTTLPLGDALKHDKMDIVVYLLQKGADYKRAMYKTVDGKDVYILEALRKCILDLDTESYKEKMEIVVFLKKKGLDYEKELIPDYILRDIKKQYPDSWQEYVKKY